MIRKTLTGILAASLLVLGALPVAAYSESYSFDITAAVYGSKEHSLSSLATSITGQGETFKADGSVSTNKDSFEVELEKGFLTSYKSGYILADWGFYTKNIGVISSGTYTVNVYKRTGNSYRVQGHGSISQ